MGETIPPIDILGCHFRRQDDFVVPEYVMKYRGKPFICVAGHKHFASECRRGYRGVRPSRVPKTAICLRREDLVQLPRRDWAIGVQVVEGAHHRQAFSGAGASE